MSNSMCARIFIDFWNLQLTINEHRGRNYRLDWRKLSPFLISEAETILGDSLRFDGTRVYISYDPKSDKDRRLKNWALNVVDRMPGIHVILKARRSRSAPHCPNCHNEIANCPLCGGGMKGTIEKGIDTAIATDMISLAWEEAWDLGILVSSDRDFIPVVEFLATKGRRVINGYFPPKGMHLARTCWASIDIRPHLADLAR